MSKRPPTITRAAVHPDDRVLVGTRLAGRAVGSDPLTRSSTGCGRMNPIRNAGSRNWGRPSLNRETGQISIVGASKDVDRKQTRGHRPFVHRGAFPPRPSCRTDVRLGLGGGLAPDQPLRNMPGSSPGSIPAIRTRIVSWIASTPTTGQPLASLLNNLRPSEHAVAQFRYDHPDGRALWFETSVMLLEQAGTRGPRRRCHLRHHGQEDRRTEPSSRGEQRCADGPA